MKNKIRRMFFTYELFEKIPKLTSDKISTLLKEIFPELIPEVHLIPIYSTESEFPIDYKIHMIFYPRITKKCIIVEFFNNKFNFFDINKTEILTI